MATPSNRSVVTRSGRAVVLRMNNEFDYSSSQSKDDGEEDSDDQSLETDDEEYQQALEFVQPKWHACKRRSLGNSSSSVCSTDESHSSPEAVPPIVYLELGEQVAIVRDEPKANIVLEDDGELKTQVHKFLGLMASRRRLYNPVFGCLLAAEANRFIYTIINNNIVICSIKCLGIRTTVWRICSWTAAWGTRIRTRQAVTHLSARSVQPDPN